MAGRSSGSSVSSMRTNLSSTQMAPSTSGIPNLPRRSSISKRRPRCCSRSSRRRAGTPTGAPVFRAYPARSAQASASISSSGMYGTSMLIWRELRSSSSSSAGSRRRSAAGLAPPRLLLEAPDLLRPEPAGGAQEARHLARPLPDDGAHVRGHLAGEREQLVGILVQQAGDLLDARLGRRRQLVALDLREVGGADPDHPGERPEPDLPRFAQPAHPGAEPLLRPAHVHLPLFSE